jgi:hypothetical protein
MNRSFFVSDPDAFTVSAQRISDQSWHEGKEPLTLNEAQVSIALAAVSGGMLEIGDNLTSLESTPERTALIKNPDLIDMVRLGNASTPMDLMSYAPSDRLPSIFYLKESNRQSILTIFNWTERSTSHSIRLGELGLVAAGQYNISGILDGKQVGQPNPGTLQIELSPHSVQILKIIDQNVPPAPPQLMADGPPSGKSGDSLVFSAHAQPEHPALSYRWDFGDGVKLEGGRVIHTWTAPGDYVVHVTAMWLDDTHAEKELQVHITGYMSTVFNPPQIQRYAPQ